ncbi:unnamed protein product [Owenia fusiformis]|uniref:Uncharacterized protein n=1 Tax=Owenia fusiformis TaxID=6347 RepID=A0A8J1XVK7_OWEFU|nr:unnamed protein product [Owenia fusiformis]
MDHNTSGTKQECDKNMESSQLLKRSRSVLSKQIYQELNRTNKDHTEKSAKLQQMYDVLKTVKRRKMEKNNSTITPTWNNNTVASYVKSLDNIGFSSVDPVEFKQNGSGDRFRKLPVTNFSSVCGDSGYGSSLYKSSISGKSDYGHTSGYKSDLTCGQKSDYGSDTYSSSENKTSLEQTGYIVGSSKSEALDIHTVSSKRKRFKKTAEALKECGLLDITKRTSALVKEHGGTVSQVQKLAKDMKAFAESVLNDPKNAHLKDMLRHNLNSIRTGDPKKHGVNVRSINTGVNGETKSEVGNHFSSNLDSHHPSNLNFTCSSTNPKRVPTIHQVSLGSYHGGYENGCKDSLTVEPNVNSRLKRDQTEPSPFNQGRLGDKTTNSSIQSGFAHSDVINDDIKLAIHNQSKTDPFISDHFDSDSDFLLQSDSENTLVTQSGSEFPLFSELSPICTEVESENSSLSASPVKDCALSEKNFGCSLQKMPIPTTQSAIFSYKGITDSKNLVSSTNMSQDVSPQRTNIPLSSKTSKESIHVKETQPPYQFAKPFQRFSDPTQKRTRPKYYFKKGPDNVLTLTKYPSSTSKESVTTVNQAKEENIKCMPSKQNVQSHPNLAEPQQQNVGPSLDFFKMLPEKADLAPETCQKSPQNNSPSPGNCHPTQNFSFQDYRTSPLNEHLSHDHG